MTERGILWISSEGMYIDGEFFPVVYPELPWPDLEITRIFWDEETQSVKQEIISSSDMYDETKYKD